MRYAIAAISVSVAGLGTLLLRSFIPDHPLSLIFFFAAIAVSSGLGGLRSGILATLLSALICDFYFLTPVHSLAVARGDVPLFVLFLMVAFLINGLSERLHAQTRMADHRFQLISRKLVNVQEAERREIARELHDEIGQNLTGIKLSLEMYAKTAPDQVRLDLAEPIELVRQLIVSVSDLSLDLRPAMLDDLGLLPTLIWQFERYSARTGVHVVFEHSGLERRFPHEIETTAYRIVQEALTNVARHSGAKEATVRLWTTRDILGIQVADQGCGFSTTSALDAANMGGLAGMEERARLIDGSFTIESNPDMGTCVSAELPLISDHSRHTSERDSATFTTRVHE